MTQFRVTVAGLNLRTVPSTGKNQPIAVMPEGTVFERGELSPDGRWAKVHVSLFGKVYNGWASASLNNYAPVSEAKPLPAGLSVARFSTVRRQAYVDSILDNPEKLNFLRPANSGWDKGVWYHSFEGDHGGSFRVGASWAAARKGELVIVSNTKPGKLFSAPRDTFCNFNVSFCYHQAYAGPFLQFLHDVEHSANDMVDLLRKEWREIPARQAARIANAGGFVIAGRKELKHGHVVFLMDGSDESGDPSGIHAFHVGGGLPRRRTVEDIWGGNLVHYVTPPETLAEFDAAGG